MMIPDWIEAAASDLYERREEIDGLALDAGQVAQDTDAGRDAWIEAVAAVIARHLPNQE